MKLIMSRALRVQRGLLRWLRGDPVEALELLDQVLAEDAQDRGALLVRAEVRLGQGASLEQPRHLRPHEHVEQRPRRHEQQYPRPNGSRADANPGQQPGAEVLQRQDVAPPGAEEAAEDGRRDHCRRHEDEAGGHDPQLQRVHDLVELQRSQRPARDLPVGNVQGNRR